jgi:hypothetical protein
MPALIIPEHESMPGLNSTIHVTLELLSEGMFGVQRLHVPASPWRPNPKTRAFAVGCVVRRPLRPCAAPKGLGMPFEPQRGEALRIGTYRSRVCRVCPTSSPCAAPDVQRGTTCVPFRG